MNNEIREKDHEWVKIFHSIIDRLLVSIEKLFESRQPGAFNDELLADKEVAHILKVSRRTLQDYRNNGILSYIQVGGKILYRTSDVQRTIMRDSRRRIGYGIVCNQTLKTKCQFRNNVSYLIYYFCINFNLYFMSYDEIIEAIDAYRRKHNRNHASKLYVGITNDIDRRLSGFHKVPRENHWWIYCPADDVNTVRQVEKYYLDQGMQGGDGGGNNESNIVYCYEVSEDTKEN